MKRILVAISIALILTFGFNRQINSGIPGVKAAESTSQDSAPTLDLIVEKYIQALGGRAAIESVTSRVMKGEVQERADFWRYEAYWKSPNKYLQIVNSTGDSGLTKMGTNGSIFWSQDNDGNVQESKLRDGMQIVREADLQADIKLRHYFPNMTLKGKKRIEGREAYWVESKSSEGLSNHWYFDVETYLLVGCDYEHKFRDNKVSFEFRYKDYKKVDGVMIPFTIERDSPSPYIHTWKEVKNNIPLDDALFEKPVAKK